MSSDTSLRTREVHIVVSIRGGNQQLSTISVEYPTSRRRLSAGDQVSRIIEQASVI